ncbi:hypothetical protein RQP53_20780 [Paucibacter sp. APW11]|uniref:Uncharacterized protein n=1 Tax=Roseateles aquae TaxID=3077235 RepID=A0ABU3PGK2_9BURK|nr:hypothetical protein [Paucibacter sp. APW11]MDT9001725.1 hypothetical protein [Paucibacter sp. APW11]
MKSFPKSAAAPAPAIQRGGLDLRLLAVIVLVALALALVWRGEWLALCTLPLVAWLGAQLGRREAPAQAGPPAQAGLGVMLEQLLPVWARLHDALNVALQSGSEDLLHSFSSMMELQERMMAELGKGPTADTAALLLQTQALGEQCERAMQGLQFGDRLTQMISVLKDELLRFESQLQTLGLASGDDARRWLDELQARYTTDEQRRFHAGEPMEPRQDKVRFF